MLSGTNTTTSEEREREKKKRTWQRRSLPPMQPSKSAPAKGGPSRFKEHELRERSPSLFQFNAKLLQDPSRLYQFRKFVETEYADENLLFYVVRLLSSPPPLPSFFLLFLLPFAEWRGERM